VDHTFEKAIFAQCEWMKNYFCFNSYLLATLKILLRQNHKVFVPAVDIIDTFGIYQMSILSCPVLI